MTSFRLAVRDNVVAILKVANTLALDRVESNRDTDVDAAEMPFLGVFTANETKMCETEGTDTIFSATLTVKIDVRIAHADLAQAERGLDILIDQVQTALLTNAAFWLTQPNGARLISKVSKIEVQAVVKQDAEINYGVGQVALDIEYTDAYQTNFSAAPPLAAFTLAVTPDQAAAAPPTPETPPTLAVTFNPPA